MPFRLLAAVTCPSHGELATALAWELGGLEPDRFGRDVAALEAAVAIEPGAEPREQLTALGEVVACAALSARRHGGPEELLLGRVLEAGHGHPLALAVVLADLGARAGLPVGIVAGDQDHYVAHQRLAEPLLLDPETGQLVDAEPLGTLTWRCGHQVSAALLDELQPRYERAGDLARALHVARLRTTLPFDDASVESAKARLRALSSRLN
jgi:Transglutaminase-like superfamily